MTKQTASVRKAGQATGSIALIAAGPGNPDLFTVRADGLARAADVVIPDLAVAGLAGHVAPNAEIVAVTDENGLPLDRPARAKLAVEHAKAGRKVVRLFAGDPLVEGTMAVELAVITRTKVPFEVVPGVSIVDGAAAYVGVPPVFGKAEEVRFVDIESVEDWSEFADQRLTLIVRNAADRAVELAKALIAAGRKPDTPIAVTRGATTVEQRTIEATLADIGPAVKAAKQAGPGLVIVGENVAQRSKFSWFETKPLFGWRILVPRTREQSRAVVEQLRGYGAVPVEVPTISVEPPRTPQQMDRAIQGMVSGRYQWVGFTSVNAVKAIREKFDEYGLDARAMAGLKIAAVGDATAAALVEFGVRPDLVPSGDQSSTGLLAEWPAYDPDFDPIDRVFLPRADIATEALTAGLEKMGWQVDDIVAYRTVRASPPPAEIREAIKTGGFDAVMFTSSSTVRNLVGIAGKPHACTIVACIGPQTAATAGEHGLRVDVLAESPSVELLAEQLAEHGAQLREDAADRGELGWRPSRKRPGARRRTASKPTG